MRNKKISLLTLSTDTKLNLFAPSNPMEEEIFVGHLCKIVLKVISLGFNEALYSGGILWYSQQSHRQGKKQEVSELCNKMCILVCLCAIYWTWLGTCVILQLGHKLRANSQNKVVNRPNKISYIHMDLTPPPLHPPLQRKTLKMAKKGFFSGFSESIAIL